MSNSFSEPGFLVQTPCGPRKSGIPESVDTPAPVNTVIWGVDRSNVDMARDGTDRGADLRRSGRIGGMTPDRDDGATGDRWVVVPARPGPLLRPSDRSGRQRDDLDELIDELLPDVDEGPGPFDVALAAIGVGLLVTGLATGATWMVVLGVLGAALGAVLPVRWVWRRSRSAQAGRATRALTDRGTVMAVDGIEVHDLISAHDALWSVAEGLTPAATIAVQGAAHQAVAEAAALLAGSAPATAEERAYVSERTRAMQDLLSDTRRSGTDVTERDARQGRVAAAAEIDALGGPSSLSRLADLRQDPEVHGGG